MQAFVDEGMNWDSRINGTESFMDVFMKLGEGNPGALRVLVDLSKGTWHNVPGLMMVLNLDSMGIYGSNIWVLYKGCCGESMEAVEQVLRAWQTGNLTLRTVHEHIEQSKRFVDLPTVEGMLAALKGELIR